MADFTTPEFDPLSSKHGYHMHLTNTTKYAYITDTLTAKAVVEADPRYTIAKERFFPMYYSIGLQKHSVYTERINRM